MKKKYIYWSVLITLPLLFLLATIIAGEFFFTFCHPKLGIYQADPEIGWVPKSNFTYEGIKSDIAGNIYDVKISTNQYGFRAWGDVASDKIKILFIGDSFTGDPNMSDKDAYYGQIKQLVDAEVFAFGGGGYGTLQELMILNKYKNIVNPDYFVLQFCSNDFNNNNFYLEGRSIVRKSKEYPSLLEGRQNYISRQ